MNESITQTIDKIEFKNISTGVAEKVDQLFPSVWIFIATIGALCLLLIILTYFLYNPVKKMVQRRKDFIQQNISESVKAKNEAYELESQARVKLLESKNVGNNIIANAKVEADQLKNEYIQQGKNEAKRIIDDANIEILSRKKSLEKETYDQIVSVAMEISEKILKDKVSEKDAKKYLDEYLGNK